MFSPHRILRFSNPNDYLIFILILSSFHNLPCALSQSDSRLCSRLFQCGNITSGYPFWGEARPEPCGHPSLVLHCDKSTNMTSLIISGQMYIILYIDNSASTLGLVRQDLLGESFCSTTFTGTTLTSELFQLLPNYKTLYIYYLCDPRFHYRSNFTCPNIGVASLDVNNNCGASFNITGPRSYLPEEGDLDLGRLRDVLRKGFEVKLMIDDRLCQKCKSAGGICSFDVDKPVCCKRNLTSDTKCSLIIPSRSSGLSKKSKLGIEFACGFSASALLVGCFFCFIIRRRKIETSHNLKDHDLKALVQLQHYSYSEVKKITKSFSHTIGKGGFGTVYVGNIRDGRKVAVKILKDFKSNGEDFINEVASMSQTSHVNIVSLLGFCYEGSKRAIVYEFLENGSLDRFISKKNSLNLDMNTLYKIALGVARGLEYLHHGCKTRIVHFDIKPQNVLLDDNLCPKLSDFGLAKLCEKRESILSLLDARGTIGYIAPEVFSRMYGRVSHKSDVYSYGMLVLEMIGARNKEEVETIDSNASSAYFPDWIYNKLENGEYTWKLEDEITNEEAEIEKKMILVGLWCIQPCPADRPPMNKVVEMMEGSLDALEIPPKPSLHHSATTLPESSWNIEKSNIT